MCGRGEASCPGRDAAFFMPLRRTGTVLRAGVRDGPGSAAHRYAKCYALRCVRGTCPSLNRHCEERSDEAIQLFEALDCFASLAMTITSAWR